MRGGGHRFAFNERRLCFFFFVDSIDFSLSGECDARGRLLLFFIFSSFAAVVAAS